MSDSEKGELLVTVKEEKNLLELDFQGMFTGEEAREGYEKVEQAVEQLDDGFAVIVDLIDFQPSTEEAAKILEKGKQLVADEGAKVAVRVLGDSVIGKMQFERYGEDDYHVATAETMEDAREMIETFRTDDETVTPD